MMIFSTVAIKYANTLMVLLIFTGHLLSGCKDSSKSSQDDSELNQFIDNQYIFYLSAIKAQDEHHAYGVVDENLGVVPNAYTFKVCKKYTLKDKISVIPGSCAFAYRDEQLKPMIIYMNNQQQMSKIQHSQYYLLEATARHDHIHNYHVAAFGTGASLNVFSGAFYKASKAAIPFLSRNRLFTFGFQLGMSFTPHHHVPSASYFNLASTEHGYIALSPDEKPINKFQHTATGGVAAVAGFASGYLLTTAGAYAAGPVGAIVGESIIPFVVTIVLNASHNPYRELLERFVSITNVATDVNEAIASDFLARVKSIPDTIEIVGKMMFLSQWAQLKDLKYFCLDNDTDNCQRLHKDYSQDHY